MKYKKLIPRAAAVLLGVMLIAFGTFGVLADNDDSSANPDSSQSEQVDPATEAPQPVTEEPQPEPQPETEAPQPETEAPQPETEPETEPVVKEPETEDPDPNYYVNNGEDSNTDATKFLISPTVPKTVSKKTYSTNYAFGAASWICAGVGIVVILAVAISTKASGRRKKVMYDQLPYR